MHLTKGRVLTVITEKKAKELGLELNEDEYYIFLSGKPVMNYDMRLLMGTKRVIAHSHMTRSGVPSINLKDEPHNWLPQMFMEYYDNILNLESIYD